MIDLIAAIDSVKFSSKSELSSRFFGRLKFSARFEYLSLIFFRGEEVPLEVLKLCLVSKFFWGGTHRNSHSHSHLILDPGSAYPDHARGGEAPSSVIVVCRSRIQDQVAVAVAVDCA